MLLFQVLVLIRTEDEDSLAAAKAAVEALIAVYVEECLKLHSV